MPGYYNIVLLAVKSLWNNNILNNINIKRDK